MSLIKILKNLPETTIFTHGYQLYIDTSVGLSDKVGTFLTVYSPLDEDLLVKKFPSIVNDHSLLRNTDILSDKNKRYFHVVNRSRKETIDRLKDVFSFVHVEVTEDSRQKLVDTDEVLVIDYSDKCVAIFGYSKNMIAYLSSLGAKLKYNSSLTGPGLKKMGGHILAKSSNKFEEIMSTLKSKPDVDDESLDDGVKQIFTKKEENKRFYIWGSDEYIKSFIEDMSDDAVTFPKIISTESIAGNRHKIEVEIVLKDRE